MKICYLDYNQGLAAKHENRMVHTPCFFLFLSKFYLNLSKKISLQSAYFPFVPSWEYLSFISRFKNKIFFWKFFFSHSFYLSSLFFLFLFVPWRPRRNWGESLGVAGFIPNCNSNWTVVMLCFVSTRFMVELQCILFPHYSNWDN